MVKLELSSPGSCSIFAELHVISMGKNPIPWKHMCHFEEFYHLKKDDLEPQYAIRACSRFCVWLRLNDGCNCIAANLTYALLGSFAWKSFFHHSCALSVGHTQMFNLNTFQKFMGDGYWIDYLLICQGFEDYLQTHF